MEAIVLAPEQVAANRAKLGFGLITEYYQGDNSWMRKIDLNTLHIANPFTCVLGQLFGDYARGLTKLGIRNGSRSIQNGFCSNSTEGVLSGVLDTAWKELITAELAAA